MLGKTNITALPEGGIVTDVEDFSWVRMESGVHTDFVRCICENGYLAAITADGVVAWTTDGEVWESVKLEYEECWLNDIDWDGGRFIIVGSYKRAVGETALKDVLVIFTEDFSAYEKAEYAMNSDARDDYEMHYVFPKNGRYLAVVGFYARSSNVNYVKVMDTDFAGHGEFLPGIYSSTSNKSLKRNVYCAKNADGMLVYGVCQDSYGRDVAIYKVDGNVSRTAEAVSKASVFQCKGTLYYMFLRAQENYGLNKVSDSGEVLTVCTGQDFSFVDGVYFDGCQVFINNHGLLVLRKGESIADKTVDDLVEVAPEMTLNCIAKAFGRLYMFGSQGVVLRSGVETDNGEVVAVQTLSAKRALAEAKAYTDARIAELAAACFPDGR